MDSNQEIKQESTLTADALPPRFTRSTMIGQGGMGVVFRSYDKTLDREVAVKLLSFEGVLDEKVQQRFLQEAKTLTSLDHFNIVKIYETGLTTTGYPFHVLEYLDGVSLSDELAKSGPLKPDRFFQIFSQVCQGLAHAHHKGIIHRDLKPGNIIVATEKGSKRTIVKLIDFGIARIADDAEVEQSQTTQTLTRTSRLLGSPAYMSPEQCRGAVVDQLSDIYSLGCIMYECLTGNTPFQVRSSMEVMYKHIHEEAPKLEPSAKTPRARKLAAMIDSCLLKDPTFRPSSVDMIIEELGNVYQSNIEFEEIKSPRIKGKVPVAKIGAATILAVGLISGGVFAYRTATNHVEVSYKSQLTPEQEKDLADLQRIQTNLYEKLDKTSDSAKRAELKTTLVKAVAAISSLQMKAGPKAVAENTVSRAMQLCKSDKPDDKILQASLLSTLAIIHGSNREQAEGHFAAAIKLVHDATGSDSSIEEEAIRRSLFKFHLSNRDWTKAKEDFVALKKIWDNAPANSKELTEVAKIDRCNSYIRSLAVNGIIADKRERVECSSLGIDLCEYAIKHNDYDVSTHGLIQCLHSLHDAPRNNTYFRLASHAYELLAQVEKETNDPSAAEHAAEAERLRKMIK